MEELESLDQPSLKQIILRISIRYLAITAGFFLIFRTGQSIKIFDLLIIILGIMLFFDSGARRFFKKIQPLLLPYFKYLILILALILLAQIISYYQNRNTSFDFGTITNYGRLVFNAYTLFLIAFIIYLDRKTLSPLSLSIFLSSFVNLPAFWKLEDGGYLAGGRLTGSLQTPLILGLWMSIVFLIGLSFFMTTKKSWAKVLIAASLVFVAGFSLWSASRAAWLALVLAMSIWTLFYFFKKDWKKLAGFLMISIFSFSFGYLLLPHEDLHIKSYIKDRAANLTHSVVTLKPKEVKAQSQTQIWPGVVDFIIHNPLGSGFGSYSPQKLMKKNGASISNNSFLELGLYGGLGAITTFLIFIFMLATKAFKAVKNRQSNSSELSLAWILGGVVVIVAIFFTDAFLWRHVWFALGMVLGIILIEYDNYAAEKQLIKPNI